jgi:hypothetical protein
VYFNHNKQQTDNGKTTSSYFKDIKIDWLALMEKFGSTSYCYGTIEGKITTPTTMTKRHF